MQKGFVPITILVVILITVFAGGGAYYYFKIKTPTQRACTLEAKLCPDGSSVGRSGPKCEFADCPSPKQTSIDVAANWKTYTNTKDGYSAQYPQKWNQLEDEASYFSPFEIKFIEGPPAPIWIYIEPESDLQLITNKYKNLEGRQDFKEEKVAVDDVESVKLSGVIKSGYLNGTLNVEVFIPKGGKIIHISYYEIEEAAPVGIFDQILSTFKFLDEKMISWEEAVRILNSGQVKESFQTHALEVTLYLKDGSLLKTKEPRIDEIHQEIQKCAICQKEEITISTE